EAIQGSGVSAEAAIAVAPGKEPGSSAIQHLFVDRAYLRHVRELQESIRRQSLVARIGAEPLVPLCGGLEAGEFLIGDFKKVSGLSYNRGIDGGVGEKVLL